MKTNINETEIIQKFFQGFAKSAARILVQNLDKDVYKKIELTFVSTSEIKDVSDLKDNNVLYKLNYVDGGYESALGLVVSEELLANITDVVMGGSGENAYKGSLSELEVNASSDLLSKIFKDFEVSFKKNYDKDLAFDAEPQFLLKDNPKYGVSFDNPVFDYLVTYSLIINEATEFKINLMLNADNIKQTMYSLRLLRADEPIKNPDIETINMDRLSDVKIEITAELGRARVPIKYALELVRGSIIELETLNNSDIKVFANGIEVAMAQVVAVEENFGLRITKIISPEERMKYI